MPSIDEKVQKAVDNLAKYKDTNDYQLINDPNAYNKSDLLHKSVEWELECALIEKSWERVKKALLMLAGAPKRKRGRPKG